MLIDTYTVRRTHYYENSRVKIKLQLEYIPCKYQENILRHENMKKETAAQWESRNEQLQEEPTHPWLHLLIQPAQVPMESNTLKKEITSEDVSFKYTVLTWEAQELFTVRLYL